MTKNRKQKEKKNAKSREKMNWDLFLKGQDPIDSKWVPRESSETSSDEWSKSAILSRKMEKEERPKTWIPLFVEEKLVYGP